MDNSHPLFSAFEKNAGYGIPMTAGEISVHLPTLNQSQWIQFANDHHLINEKVSKQDALEIFEEAKFKRDHQITFRQFIDALQLLARKMYPTADFDLSLTLLINEITEKQSPATPSKSGRYIMVSQKVNGIHIYNLVAKKTKGVSKAALAVRSGSKITT
jgi:hypothetical protein